MDLQPKFLGTLIKHSEAKPGDLVLVDDGTSTRLVFVGEGSRPGSGNQAMRGIVLNEWGNSTPNKMPYSLDFSVMHAHGKMLRKLGPDLVVSPSGKAADELFLPEKHRRNGSIVALPDGTFALVIATNQNGGATYAWNLKTGQQIAAHDLFGADHHAMSRWKLVWLQGQDECTLFELNAPDAQLLA